MAVTWRRRSPGAPITLRTLESRGEMRPAPARVAPALGPCLTWPGSTSSRGYGEIWIGAGKKRFVHRLAWIARHGEPPPETPCVLHHCDVRACFADAHLWLGTKADNNRDMAAKGRVNNGERSKTHCPRDHPYSGSNLRIDGRGRRECRACRRALDQRRRLARSA